MSGRYRLPPRTALDWHQGQVYYMDQRRLPRRLEVVGTGDWRSIARAIKSLAIRGAPLIGVAAGFGVVLSAAGDVGRARQRVSAALQGLGATRPTARNLFGTLERMRGVSDGCQRESDLHRALLREALAIQKEDRRACSDIGKNGAALIPANSHILTICNTGFLATAGVGTALAVIYHAADSGKRLEVFVCETRPLLQGARLTVWELAQSRIQTTLMVDSAAAGLLARGGIDVCIIGADRIAANGDTVNKVGSYQLALACKRHEVPFYVAAPGTTIDSDIRTGRDVPIEERPGKELSAMYRSNMKHKRMKIWNPAFDLVPADLISGIITEQGVYRPRYRF